MARETFGDLAQLTAIGGATEALPAMVEFGWTSPSLLRSQRAAWKNLPLTEAQMQCLSAAVDMWFHSQSPVAVTVKRRDMPVLKPRGQGSLDEALKAAAFNQREETLRQFHDEIYAKSNSDTNKSRLKTWRKLAEAWQIAAWPIEVDTVWKIGASLKAGGYKSAKLYFSAALKHHTMQHGEPNAAVRLAVRDATRSIERGLGGSQLKDAFELEAIRPMFCDQNFSEVEMAFT